MAKNPTPKVVTKKHLARIERERIQSRYLTIAAAAVIFLIIGLVGFGFLDQNFLLARRPVAKVGNQEITTREFQTQVRFTRWQLIRQYESTLQLMQMFGGDSSSSDYFTRSLQQIQGQLDSTNASVLGGNVLDSMISDRVIRQEAARRGITVTDEEIELAMQEQFGFFPEGTPTPTITPTPYATSTLSPTQLALVPPTATPTITPTSDATDAEVVVETPEPESTPETLAPTSAVSDQTPTPGVEAAQPQATDTPEPTATAYTYEGYQGRVQDLLGELNEIGFTEKDLRYLVESQLFSEKLRDALTTDIQTEEEQVWARHILVPDEATAVVILEKLKNGEDFAELAAEFSTDESNKSQGGDLRWFGRGRMVAEFEAAAFDLEIGEISQPVKTIHGYHIIQLLGKEVRPLSSTELEQKRDRQFQDWLAESLAEESVKKYDLWQNVVPTDPNLQAA